MTRGELQSSSIFGDCVIKLTRGFQLWNSSNKNECMFLGPIFLILLCFNLNASHSAGVATHLSVLFRSIPKHLIQYKPWLKAGAFFPDALYSCKPDPKWQEFAEFTHWPEFILIALDYWKEKYGLTGLSETPDALALQSFVLGVFNHQIVDVSWHSLVEGFTTHGLVKVFAELEFDGDIENAHNFVDVIGDLYTLNNWVREDKVSFESWKSFSRNDWALPVEGDLMAIVAKSGLNTAQISYQELNYCVKRGLIAVNSEIYSIRTGRAAVLRRAQMQSPIAAEFLQEHYMGGEWDLISMTKKCVPVLNSLFDDKIHKGQTVLEQIRLCGNLPAATSHNAIFQRGISSKQLHSNGRFISSLMPFSKFGTAMTIGKFYDDDELYLAVSSPLEDSMGSIYLIPWSVVSGLQGEDTQTILPVTSMFGSTVKKYSMGGVDFLVISEPGVNEIKFFRGKILVLSLFADEHSEVSQLEVVAISESLQFDMRDIVLSSVSFGFLETGVVFVIKGREIIKLLFNGHVNQVINIFDLNLIDLTNSITLKDYSHFGSSVAISPPFKDDSYSIYVTAQSLGAVFVYHINDEQQSLSPKFVINMQSIFEWGLSPKPIHIIPSSSHQMFGGYIHSWEYTSRKFFSISQKLQNKVCVYEDLNGSIRFHICLKLVHSVNDVPYNTGFGSAVAYNSNRNILLISSPNSFGGDGAIFSINLSEIIDRKPHYKTLLVSSKYLYYRNSNDNEGFTNFGSCLSFGPNETLLVGIPQYGYSFENHYSLTGGVIVI
ncbi:uncharacterized protein KNAG_0C02670 [Huiozyma naganishii CBS 8797]|uniref:Phospholipase C/D domain-containing protein n=1 Tax=Huiozyma naganishii (strain ATCC MYA-139 / BCRC 22969 / CBS 8797 / KCTC 17520 / NBRC 10181 / NCYC 3082 / Yp74L-3) TaxID=1071383 RepID=J7RIM8_HUIN7|nr:hypothetical protein KNAG_0C02670 [Kazachstania naganishii CBS 8797]CCK69378.1 hypothetical protein KNAG_0C02670 [Kazachstania naganishii CBS 8797]